MLAASATSLSPHNPLNQFAEITLAASMATQKDRARHHDILLAQYLSQLQGQLDLTPSNSPSPPPAHLSPSLKTHLKGDALPPLSNPYGIGKEKDSHFQAPCSRNFQNAKLRPKMRFCKLRP